jgi:uncharacterized membrane protein
MDVWVRSEYAGELAVLSAWIAALLPWSVSVSRVFAGGLLVVRFAFVEVRYAIGVPFTSAVDIVDPFTAAAVQRGTASATGYRLWSVGAAVVAVAVALSVVYYRREGLLEDAPVDPVRALGVLILVGSVVLGAATASLFTGFPGLTLPVGVPLTLALAVVLLLAERQGD